LFRYSASAQVGLAFLRCKLTRVIYFYKRARKKQSFSVPTRESRGEEKNKRKNEREYRSHRVILDLFGECLAVSPLNDLTAI